MGSYRPEELFEPTGVPAADLRDARAARRIAG